MSMQSPDFVVTINHGGQQKIHKIALSQNQIVFIGRSWRSDIVVNDEYMDPQHLKLSLDSAGELQVEDLNTKNGTRLEKRTLQHATQYKKGTELQIGDSTVSVYNTAESVAPALKRDTVQKLSGKYHSIFWYILATLAAAVGLAITHVLLNYDEITSERAASIIGRTAFTAVVITLIGGLMSKLFRQKFLFGLHYMFVCWMFLLHTLATFAWDIVEFNIEPGLLTKVIGETLFFALGLLVVFGVMSMASRVTRYKRLTMAAVMLLLPTTFQVITPMLETDYNAWDDHISMDAVSQPPIFQFKTASSVESHLQASDKLFAKVSNELDWASDASKNPKPADHDDKNSIQVSEID